MRTIYFSTFADESPEPRYVLECFPAVIALGAQVFRARTLAPLRMLPKKHAAKARSKNSTVINKFRAKPSPLSSRASVLAND